MDKSKRGNTNVTKIQVGVTFCAWPTRILGNEKSSVKLEEHIEKGGTFEDLLNHLVDNYPALKDTLIDPVTQKLYDEIVVIVNGKSLDPIDGMQTHLKNEDSVEFLPCLPGG